MDRFTHLDPQVQSRLGALFQAGTCSPTDVDDRVLGSLGQLAVPDALDCVEKLGSALRGSDVRNISAYLAGVVRRMAAGPAPGPHPANGGGGGRGPAPGSDPQLVPVAQAVLDDLYASGKVRRGDLDGRTLAQLAGHPADAQHYIMHTFSERRLQGIRSMPAFFTSHVTQMEREIRESGVPRGNPRGGPPGQGMPPRGGPPPPHMMDGRGGGPPPGQMRAPPASLPPPQYMGGPGAPRQQPQYPPQQGAGMPPPGAPYQQQQGPPAPYQQGPPQGQQQQLGGVYDPQPLQQQPLAQPPPQQQQAPVLPQLDLQKLLASLGAAAPPAGQAPAAAAPLALSPAPAAAPAMLPRPVSARHYGLEQLEWGVRVDEFHGLSPFAKYVHPAAALKLQQLWDSGNKLVSLLDDTSWEALAGLDAQTGASVVGQVSDGMRGVPDDIVAVNQLFQSSAARFPRRPDAPTAAQLGLAGAAAAAAPVVQALLAQPPPQQQQQPMYGGMGAPQQQQPGQYQPPPTQYQLPPQQQPPMQQQQAPPMQYPPQNGPGGMLPPPGQQQPPPYLPHQQPPPMGGGGGAPPVQPFQPLPGALGDLPTSVQQHLSGLMSGSGGMLTPEHLDHKVIDMMQRMGEGMALRALDEFARNDFRNMRSVTAYLIGVLRKYQEGQRLPPPGPDRHHPGGGGGHFGGGGGARGGGRYEGGGGRSGRGGRGALHGRFDERERTPPRGGRASPRYDPY